MLDFLVLGDFPGTQFQISFDFLLDFFAVVAAVALLFDQRIALKLEYNELLNKYQTPMAKIREFVAPRDR